jgi:hypothetical protein
MKVKRILYQLTHWETWHYLAKYIPIMPVWLWYCLRARSFWFFMPSNPTLTFGGFEGESKKEMFDQLPNGSYPKSMYISHTMDFSEVEKRITENEFIFPLAVKPDVGMMGFMFRKIDNISKLKQYHETMPATYIIQDLVTYPMEVSVFYYRMPYETKGKITGFLRKEFLQVTGDGVSSLGELISHYPRVQFRQEEMKCKHKGRLDDIIPSGEAYCLSNALNLSRGGKLISLAHEKDERLLKVFDDLSHYTNHFYYGRYDIKCASVEDLKEGRNFYILEYNGCGAEPHHIYGDGNTLLQAYAILLQHWKVLYRISKYNHTHGASRWGFMEGWKFLSAAKKHFKTLKQLDVATEL